MRRPKSVGHWLGCARSLAIWWFPRSPIDVQQSLNGVKFDAHHLIGEHWKEACVIHFDLGDEPSLVADAGLDRDGSFDDCAIDVPEDAASIAEGGSPSALSVSAVPEETDSDFSGHIQQ
eukprot:9493283-Pyramimonas_sp.AAC.1